MLMLQRGAGPPGSPPRFFLGEVQAALPRRCPAGRLKLRHKGHSGFAEHPAAACPAWLHNICRLCLQGRCTWNGCDQFVDIYNIVGTWVPAPLPALPPSPPSPATTFFAGHCAHTVPNPVGPRLTSPTLILASAQPPAPVKAAANSSFVMESSKPDILRFARLTGLVTLISLSAKVDHNLSANRSAFAAFSSPGISRIIAPVATRFGAHVRDS